MRCTLAFLGRNWWHEIEAWRVAETRQLCTAFSLASLVKLETPLHYHASHAVGQFHTDGIH